MTHWTFQKIQKKVREVTGRFSPNDLSDLELKEIINRFYTVTFPNDAKVTGLRTYFSFACKPNQAYYPAPWDVFSLIEPNATCNNYNLDFSVDASFFNELYPEQYQELAVGDGDGVKTIFSITSSGFPIMPSTFTGGSFGETFLDKNKDWSTTDVTIEGSNGGQVVLNYSLGTIVFNFATPPAIGDKVSSNFIKFVASRPRALLLHENFIKLYPVPDSTYLIRMQGNKKLQDMILSTDQPEQEEWGAAIAYGSSREIFFDHGEEQKASVANAAYQKHLETAMSRTHEEIMEGRSIPSW